MDSGGYNFIYTDKDYQILDETDYFAVHKNYKHIASFKERDAAFEYVWFLKYKPKNTIYKEADDTAWV